MPSAPSIFFLSIAVITMLRMTPMVEEIMRSVRNSREGGEVDKVAWATILKTFPLGSWDRRMVCTSTPGRLFWCLKRTNNWLEVNVKEKKRQDKKEILKVSIFICISFWYRYLGCICICIYLLPFSHSWFASDVVLHRHFWGPETRLPDRQQLSVPVAENDWRREETAIHRRERSWKISCKSQEDAVICSG